MKTSKFEKYTISEIIYDFLINISYIIIPIIFFIISFVLLWKLKVNIIQESESINTLANSFITVSGILPGILLTFVGNIANLSDENQFVKNIKQQGYSELLYRIIFVDIALLIITLIFSIFILLCKNEILIYITISLFISSIVLFAYGFFKLAQVTILTSR